MRGPCRLSRLLFWEGVDEWRAEAARAELGPDGLRARGTQLGGNPVPYRLDYELDASAAGLVTRRLSVRAESDGWARSLELVHDGEGAWSCEASDEGDVALGPAGGDMEAVRGALDCDLGRCPLTNTMPVLRHDLHRRPGEVDFLMAWVSVPDLAVHPSVQRYEHVSVAADGGSVVRYVGEHRDFVGELELDRDGFVVFYPELARRVGSH
jgi:uncharacterized protein